MDLETMGSDADRLLQEYRQAYSDWEDERGDGYTLSRAVLLAIADRMRDTMAAMDLLMTAGKRPAPDAWAPRVQPVRIMPCHCRCNYGRNCGGCGHAGCGYTRAQPVNRPCGECGAQLPPEGWQLRGPWHAPTCQHYEGPRPVPDDFPVKVLTDGQPAKDRATCGICGRSWDDGIATAWTPAPSGRCPFEYFH